MPQRAPFAKTVVWRHPCNCASASRPLEPGETAEHRFDVDGAPFPWHIAEHGAQFAARGGVYLVNVLMFPLKAANNEVLDFRHTFNGRPRFVDVAGDEVEFPWALHGPIVYAVDHHSIPTLDLTFIARHVDADIPISAEETPT